MNDYCFASWYITEKCNFRCSYCYIYNPSRIKRILRTAKKILKPGRRSGARYDLYKELDHVLERFLQTGMRVTFGFTGGEPLVFPRFFDICKRIVSHDNFKIALDTNLSTRNVDHLIDAAPPEKVEYIYAALHILERERIFGEISSFIDNVVLLKDKGYSIAVNYVMHPALFDRIEKDYTYCLDRGVQLSIKHFKGMHDGKTYPAAYTKEQRDIISRYSPNRGEEKVWSTEFLGCLCKAGKNLIRIKGNGDITRCAGDHTLLGNIFTGFELFDAPRPCMLKKCPCFSPDRLIDDPSARVDVPALKVWAAGLRHTINKLRGWWEQE
jgi:MoaA/NifB/PqqE/SkfB family radical SAM enzyme